MADGWQYRPPHSLMEEIMALSLTFRDIVAVAAAQSAIALHLGHAGYCLLPHADLHKFFVDRIMLNVKIDGVYYEADVDFRSDAEYDYFLELRANGEHVRSYWIDCAAGPYGVRLLEDPQRSPREL